MTPEQAVKRWRKLGPAVFAQECMGARATDQQLEAGRALVERKRITIRSGHGTGKSAFLAWSIIWFLLTRYPVKIPCTAPTAAQLSNVLWSEVALWLNRLRDKMPQLAAQLGMDSESIYISSAKAESFAVARTARPENPDALQGFHAKNLLFIVDEASGVADKVFEVAEGALSTKNAYIIMCGNPTRQDGYFYESHHKDRAQWHTMHWDGETSPLVSREYVERMLVKYGEQSPIYQVRVKGNFVSALDGVIPLEFCTSAVIRDVKPYGDYIWGVDVARFGDDSSALAKRCSNVLLEPVKEWYGKDTMQLSGIIKAEYDSAKIKPVAIHIDVIGIGSGVVDRLKEMGLPVRGINVAESASVSDKYARQRDELWFRGREWLEARDCKLADDDGLIAELTTPTYSLLSNGKIKVEGKDELKRRGVASPNKADAFLLTMAQTLVNARHNKPIKYSNLGIV